MLRAKGFQPNFKPDPKPSPSTSNRKVLQLQLVSRAWGTLACMGWGIDGIVRPDFEVWVSGLPASADGYGVEVQVSGIWATLTWP